MSHFGIRTALVLFRRENFVHNVRHCLSLFDHPERIQKVAVAVVVFLASFPATHPTAPHLTLTPEWCSLCQSNSVPTPHHIQSMCVNYVWPIKSSNYDLSFFCGSLCILSIEYFIHSIYNIWGVQYAFHCRHSNGMVLIDEFCTLHFIKKKNFGFYNICTRDSTAPWHLSWLISTFIACHAVFSLLSNIICALVWVCLSLCEPVWAFASCHFFYSVCSLSWAWFSIMSFFAFCLFFLSDVMMNFYCLAFVLFFICWALFYSWVGFVLFCLFLLAGLSVAFAS